jgi:hypothetical protein
MDPTNDCDESSDNDRRRFLETCGKFAAITPPTIMMLLSTSLTSGAIAASSKGNKGGVDPNTKGDPSNKGKKIGNGKG